MDPKKVSNEVARALDLLKQDVSIRLNELRLYNHNQPHFNLEVDADESTPNPVAGLSRDEYRIKNQDHKSKSQKPHGLRQHTMTSMILNGNSVIMSPRIKDSAKLGSSIFWEPLLVSLVDSLRDNVFDVVKSGYHTNITNAKRKNLNDFELKIAVVIDQFKKELLIYEQQKFKDYNTKVEQLTLENSKLAMQIAQLKERWDGLVESAKKRRGKV